MEIKYAIVLADELSVKRLIDDKIITEKQVSAVLLCSDFEKAKNHYIKILKGLPSSFSEREKEFLMGWFVECFGVER